jgi:hypothetical protein
LDRQRASSSLARSSVATRDRQRQSFDRRNDESMPRRAREGFAPSRSGRSQSVSRLGSSCRYRKSRTFWRAPAGTLAQALPISSTLSANCMSLASATAISGACRQGDPRWRKCRGRSHFTVKPEATAQTYQVEAEGKREINEAAKAMSSNILR